jgi:hypothetical protein
MTTPNPNDHTQAWSQQHPGQTPQYPDYPTNPPGYYAPPQYYGPQGGYAPQQAPAPVNPEKNGFGITGAIMGPVGLLFCLMPITGFIGLTIGFIGFVLSAAGLNRVSKNKATNKKTAVFGLVTCLLAIAFGIYGVVLFFQAMNDLGTGLDCLSNADTTAEIDACN